MTIIGAGAVENAGKGGRLVVAKGDVVTPLAAERARDLGVTLVGPDTPAPPTATATVPKAAAAVKAAAEPPKTAAAPPVSTGRPTGTATVNALYRRGAPVPAAADPDRPARPRVAVIGAGHVGSITTTSLAESGLFDEVVLVDVVDGLAAGIALDIWHSAGLVPFATRITGSADLAAIAGVDYVVVTAGKARKPGMTRTDLTAANAEIVGPVAERIAELAPRSVIVVVTNPLEEMTHLVQLRSGFPATRVLGMAGVLDSARFHSLVAGTGICRPQDVHAYALGSHGPEMVVPLSLATVGGRPLRELLAADVLDAVVERTRDSGAEVVGLLKTGSAYFAPGRSAALMVSIMAGGSDRVVACAVEPAGRYGLSGTRVGLPVRLGRDGLAEIVELPLEPAEAAALRAAADRLAERIREVGQDAGGGLRRAG